VIKYQIINWFPEWKGEGFKKIRPDESLRCVEAMTGNNQENSPTSTVPCDAVGLNELLPCPFCGGKAKILRLEHEHKKYYKIYCTKCNVRQYRKRKKHEAIKAWNTRAR